MHGERHPEARGKQPSKDLAIVILAGGRATRFPGKLEARFAGEPLLAHVYHHVRDIAPTLIAARDTFSVALDAELDCPIVIDRWPDHGPLGGLLSAAYETQAPWIFAIAGDAPLVVPGVVEALRSAWRTGDQAVVPEHEGRLEPLAALYDRAALLREAWECLHGGDRSMHALLARLRVRRVPLDAKFFANINTSEDLTHLQETV
ncbi:MAG TPA: molybdenum cofactor guanylyltransferase [Candidatus Acidoferrales bacterium]|nr:molybdenum cofactor guanylyltransferase [Candidatus Acidoferrales bacterium]